MPVITCRVLGSPEVLVDGTPPPAELMWRKNLALIVYLARSPRRTRSRDHLMGLFWADKPETSARHSLREAIRVLRKSVGDEGLLTEHDQVRLAEGAVRLDVDDFAALEADGDWKGAAEMVAGEFLEGFGVPDSSGFEDWIISEREEWRRRTVRALVSHAASQLSAGRSAEAAASALRACTLDPGANAAARVAMQALALSGDRSGALACYERLAARLDELGAKPEANTETLARRIQQERVWHLSGAVPVEPGLGAESRRAPLVGREQQLRQLLDLVAGAVGQRRVAVGIIVGDQGLGKSRLAEEMLARARLQGATVAAVRAVEGDLTLPGHGLLGLARGGLLGGQGLAAAAPAALAALAGEIPEWADRFGNVSAAPAALPVAFVEILRALALEQPVVLLADDAHWLDGESVRALVQAARDLENAPFVVVFSAQEQPSRTELDDLRSRLGHDLPGITIHLQPLEASAVRELAQWAAPTYTPEEVDRLARRVASDSAGIPLLAIELLHAVALGMDFGVIAGAWPEPLKTLDQSFPSDLPDAIVAAIRVGYRRLSNDAQALLAAAAVLGGRVTADTLGRAVGVTDARLAAALDELEWQRWLSADPHGYTFVARITRDVVNRDMVLEGQRQRILSAV
jgi:DNA-binding SARP family transcriptional activator